MIERAITKRVATLGRAFGVARLSAHDCRHYWATDAARNGTPIDEGRERRSAALAGMSDVRLTFLI